MGSCRIRTVAFRSPAEKPTPRSRQALSPSLETVYWLARPLVQLQIHASQEDHFVLFPSEAMRHSPILCATRALIQRDAHLDLYFFVVLWRATPLTCVRAQ